MKNLYTEGLFTFLSLDPSLTRLAMDRPAGNENNHFYNIGMLTHSLQCAAPLAGTVLNLVFLLISHMLHHQAPDHIALNVDCSAHRVEQAVDG